MMRIKIVSMADCWEHLGVGGLRGLLLIDVSDWLHGDLFLKTVICVCVCGIDILQMITEHHMTLFSASTLLLPPHCCSSTQF